MRYRRPAVYIERADAAKQEPLVLRTDIAAFAGIARRGPLDTPVPVESYRQFAAHFGDFTGTGYLAYAVRGFFENGGRRCWVVRVANRDASGGALAASTVINDVALLPSLIVSASSSGNWGNALSLEVAVETGATAISIPGQSSPQFATAFSVATFEPSTLVRIEQVGLAPVYRVISAIDTSARRLYWVHPDPSAGLLTDRVLTGLDLTQPLRISRVAYSMTVREAGTVRAVYRDLHLAPSHPRFAARILGAPSYTPYWLAPQDQEKSADLPRPAEAIIVTSAIDDLFAIPNPLDVIPGEEIPLSGGSDGLAALSPYDFVGEPVVPGDSDFVKRRKQRGLECFATIEEIALVAVPDILIRPDPDPIYEPVPPPDVDPCIPCPPPAPVRQVHQPLTTGELPPEFSEAQIAGVQATLLQHCETLRDRFAVLSLPFRLASDPAVGRDELIEWRDQFETRIGALYVPWLDVLEPRRTTPTRRIPGCGHLVGAIARTDLAWGVHRAPGAVLLDGVTDLSRLIDDIDHGELNDSGLNILRAEFGRGPEIGGARTLSHDPDWRFINVVRLVLAIKKGIDLALRWVVFEPNDDATRASVAATLTELLQTFYERGAFQGATAEDSYFVRCDEVTTPAEARDAGELVALVGIAPAAPCEFIVLRIGKERSTLMVTLFEPEALNA